MLAIVCLSHPARALTQDDVLSAEVLPGWRTEQGTYMTALRLTLAGFIVLMLAYAGSRFVLEVLLQRT